MVDPVVALEAERGDPVAVADRADHGQQLALGDVGRAAHRLDALDDGAICSSVAPSFITIIMFSVSDICGLLARTACCYGVRRWVSCSLTGLAAGPDA